MRFNLCLNQKILTLKVTRYCLKEKKNKRENIHTLIKCV